MALPREKREPSEINGVATFRKENWGIDSHSLFPLVANPDNGWPNDGSIAVPTRILTAAFTTSAT
jgi:hypothetical protein